MNFKEKFKKFISDSKRVLVVSKKPTGDEFLTTFKITGIGIVALGIVGLITFLIFHFVLGG